MVFGLVPGTEDLKSVNWKLFDEKLPLHTPEKLRQLFMRHDGNANGYLSLAEVEKLLMEVSWRQLEHTICKKCL